MHNIAAGREEEEDDDGREGGRKCNRASAWSGTPVEKLDHGISKIDREKCTREACIRRHSTKWKRKLGVTLTRQAGLLARGEESLETHRTFLRARR